MLFEMIESAICAFMSNLCLEALCCVCCRQHHEQVHKYVNTLENLVFTSDIDIHILKVFQQFCALRS